MTPNSVLILANVDLLQQEVFFFYIQNALTVKLSNTLADNCTDSVYSQKKKATVESGY